MRILASPSILKDTDDFEREQSHCRLIEDPLSVRHRDLPVILISEYFQNFFVYRGFEDGHALVFDGLKAGLPQLLYHLSLDMCLQAAFVSAEDETVKVVIQIYRTYP